MHVFWLEAYSSEQMLPTIGVKSWKNSDLAIVFGSRLDQNGMTLEDNILKRDK